MSYEKAISERYKNETCMNCLGELKGGIKKTIDMMGYGSIFDNYSTKIHLCGRCYEDSPDIWGLNVVDVSSEWGGSPGDFFAYEYEEEIYEYVSNMPIEGRELFWNRLGSGGSHFPMDPDEWIDWWCLTFL